MRGLVKILAALVVLAVAAAGLLAWRLSRGPLPLAFLKDRIEAAGRDIAPGVRLSLASVAIVWDPRRWRIDLAATDVRVANADGRGGLNLPLVALRPNLRALLEGRVALGAVELISPELTLIREADGSIDLGAGGGGDRVDLPLTPGGAPPPIGVLGVRGGHVTLRDDASGREWTARAVDARLRFGADAVTLEASLESDLQPLLGKPSPLHAEIAADLRRGEEVVDLRQATVDLGDVQLRVTGQLRGSGAAIAAAGEMSVATLPTAAIARYWPADLVPEARSWVTANITGGQLRDVGLRLAVKKSTEDAPLELAEITGQAVLAGLSVRFLDDMPPVRAVAGRASLTAKGARFDVTAGRLLDLELTSAAVDLPIGGSPRIAIDANLAGPLASMVTVLDNPPVRLKRGLGFEPQKGRVVGKIHLAFPLRDGLRVGDLGLKVAAKLSAVDVARLRGEWSLAGGDFTLAIERTKLHLEGSGRVEGVQVHVDQRLDFEAPREQRIALKATPDRAGRQALGLDPGAWLEGPVAADVLVSGGGASIAVDLDLRPASIDLPGPSLAKAAGVPGRAQATLRIRDGRVVAVERARARWADNALSGRAARSTLGTWTLAAETDLAPAPGRGPGAAVLQVEADRSFTLESGNFGDLVAPFGRNYGQGGKLDVEGTVDLTGAGLPLDARVSVTGLRMTNEPFLARLLTLASLRGALGNLTGAGIRFDTIDALLHEEGGIVTVREGVGRSDSFALVARGTIDLDEGMIDFRGSLVPSYFGVNQGLGKLPIIGGLLTGGEEKAVQAFDYRARGPASDPKVSVDGLSSLTPRVLSDLYRRIESGLTR